MSPRASFPVELELLISWKANCVSRLTSLRTYRLPWWAHWALLADMFLPRRYRWFITPNAYSRGSPLNAQIVDETGVLAARTLATGLLANLTSPTKQWFRFGLHGVDIEEGSAAAIWLAECTNRTHEVFAESNLYSSLGTAYHDNAVFGSAAQIQYEDDEDVVRFVNPCLGEFFFGLDARLEVCTLAREYTYTIQEAVDEFGLEALSVSLQAAYKTGGNSKDTDIIISHIIEPNDAVWANGKMVGVPLPSRFKYREIFWEQSGSQSGGPQSQDPQAVLRVSGFLEKPFVGLRWDVTSNDAYGRSPGMDALPAVRQLQIEQRRKAEAIDKMVRPPMVASVSMKNEPMDILPGGVTFTADPAAAGFKPAFSVEPRIAEFMEDIQEVQSRVKEIFFNPLFTRIMDETKVQTATWVDAATQEKLVLLGPVVERTENEGLDDILSRTFNIMSRRGLYPPAPPEISGAPISIQYISMLAEAQRAASTAAIERVFGFAGNLAAAIPQILDNLDADEAISEYADLLNAPPEILRSAQQVAAIRQQRDAETRAAAALQTGQAMATGAKTLSDTNVGGGQNALQSMLQ